MSTESNKEIHKAQEVVEGARIHSEKGSFAMQIRPRFFKRYLHEKACANSIQPLTASGSQKVD
jgi:hypothetical protein